MRKSSEWARRRVLAGAFQQLAVIKRARLMERLPDLRPLDRLAEIFRAQRGDKEAQRTVIIGEAVSYLPAVTFAEFLAVNKVPVFEEVVR